MTRSFSDIKSRFMEVLCGDRFIFLGLIVVLPRNVGIGWIGDFGWFDSNLNCLAGGTDGKIP